jgi:hypothetical protein
VVFGALVAGCDQPQPRSFNDFMEDAIAREGALARCNQDRDATLNDIECANARRAAAALAVRGERERREQLDRESQRKLLALRERAALQEAAAAQAAAAKRAAEEAAYEARWRDPTKTADGNVAGSGLPGDAAATAPAFGAPLEAPLPAIAASHSPTEFESSDPGAALGTETSPSAAPAAGTIEGPSESAAPVAAAAAASAIAPPQTVPVAATPPTEPTQAPPATLATPAVAGDSPPPAAEDGAATSPPQPPPPSAIPRPFQSNGP